MKYNVEIAGNPSKIRSASDLFRAAFAPDKTGRVPPANRPTGDFASNLHFYPSAKSLLGFELKALDRPIYPPENSDFYWRAKSYFQNLIVRFERCKLS